MSGKYCGACGRRSKLEFCGEACQQAGYRRCACGEVLRRDRDESSHNFRERRFCGSVCRSLARSERRTAEWRDPVLRERFLRGMLLSSNTPEQIERSSLKMKTNHQNQAYVARLRQSHRLFSAEQVHAIRSDRRSHTEIASDYGVDPGMIGKIRNRITYKDV